MMQTAVHMYDYHVWANKTMLARLKELPRELYVQEIQSVFPSISKVMPHIYVTDYCWLDILSGSPMKETMAAANEWKDRAESRHLDQLETMFDELSERYHAFFRGQDRLDQTIVLDNPYADVRETSYSEIVLQVVNHGTYHRGNITAMLRQLGQASVMTEYALYWYS